RRPEVDDGGVDEIVPEGGIEVGEGAREHDSRPAARKGRARKGAGSLSAREDDDRGATRRRHRLWRGGGHTERLIARGAPMIRPARARAAAPPARWCTTPSIRPRRTPPTGRR